LVAQDQRVRVLVRPSTLARAGVASDLAKHAGVEVVAADFTDRSQIARAADGVDVIFHLAWQWKRSSNAGAESDSGAGGDSSVEAIERNLNAATCLLAASSAHGVRRFVFTSSVAVYGPPAMIRQFPVTEEADVIQGDYGSSPFVQYYMTPKIAIEHMIRSYSKQCGLEYVILRPSVVYGPNAPFAERLVHNTLATARWVSRDGARGKWQMVHVDDVAQAVVLAGAVPEAKNLEFNIAGGEVATEEEIKMMIWAAASQEPPDAEPAAHRGARFESYEFPRYDISRAGQVLKYVPQVPLREGLREVVATVLSAPGAEEPAHSPEPAASPRPSPARVAETFDIREFYDDRVESEFLTDYFEHSGFWNFGYRITGAETPREACENLMERLLKMNGEPRGTILDIACGNGATTAYLTRYFAPERITAINFSLRQMARAVERAPGCRFVLMDATALAFPDNSFDQMICVEAAFHFQTRDAFLREAVRVLKPGGRLALADAVLPPASQTQPRANYVADAGEYRARCLAAGFSAVEITDATSQCWAAFSADLAHYTRRKLREGEITLRRFYEVMLWLRHLGPERYILASCQKRSDREG
jgi:nucleoside-diphosphate-sugar epimerase/SAM-dependent methyltransferase